MKRSHPYQADWDSIRAELKDMAPLLAERVGRIPLVTPDAYFEGLPKEVQTRIDSEISKDYFETLPGRVLDRIRKADYQLPEASSRPYEVPAGYFEGLSASIKENTQSTRKSKVVPLFQQPWMRLAVAAVTIMGIVATILLLNRPSKVDRDLATLDKAELEEYIEQNIDEYELYQLVEYVDADEADFEILPDMSDSTLLEMEKEIDDLELEDIWL